MTGVRAALRTGTAAHHDRVDALFSQIDLADREAYGRFLMAQAAAHLRAERSLDEAGAAAVLPDWPDRRRSELLLADLAALGLAPPPIADPIHFGDAAALLGGVYVLEGSRLGGALLRRSVPATLPARFLGASDPGGWRRLLTLLDERVQTAEEIRHALNAACDVFLLFEEGGRRFLKVV